MVGLLKDAVLYVIGSILFALAVCILAAACIISWAVVRAAFDAGPYRAAVRSRWGVAWAWFDRTWLQYL